ncbi:secretogranin_V domain-containing protein 7B2 [Ptiloglossa arizonensis]|uniref:secretogranin_V domain-containing protein 7B2 n=1 Tax=Ptiloglossa arizonensis TaxID=3350558 RepID=UPI003FA0B58A
MNVLEIMYWIPFLSLAVAVQATVYLPPPIREEQLLTDTLLRELINQMGNDLADTADSYLEYQDKPKEIPLELPADYDSMDTLNPNPSIRDQEYLRHSTLWAHQRLNSKEPYNRQRIKPGSVKIIKDEKAENTLPAYCTPPNPCPVGYTSENNCIVNFENTATFSRDYQSAQDCTCDTEHMLDCPVDSVNSNSLPSMDIPNSNFNQIVDQFQAEDNPFFRGEKLPIAAKKGINVVY